MATTFTEKQKNALIKKFHTLLTRGGIGNSEKEAMLAGYGVESTRDLTVYELTELCIKTDRIVNPAQAESDKLRKRLIASISSYRHAMSGVYPPMEEIKAIACRAGKVDNFNRITDDRLRSLYNAFNKMRKDLESVTQMTKERIHELTTMN